MWTDMSPSELLVFFALMLIMPLIKKYHLQDYWKNDALISTPVFGKYMAHDRFLLLLSLLHFADNNNPSSHDRIREVQSIFTMLLDRYEKFFHPTKNMVIDQSLILFKECVTFK